MADNPDTAREYRDDFGFGRRHGFGNLVYVIPGAIALYFCVRYVDAANAKLWIPLGVFIGCVAFGICFDWFRLRNYHCPSCGRDIPQPTLEQRSAGTPRCYYCADCNIEWDTGLRIPED